MADPLTELERGARWDTSRYKDAVMITGRTLAELCAVARAARQAVTEIDGLPNEVHWHAGVQAIRDNLRASVAPLVREEPNEMTGDDHAR